MNEWMEHAACREWAEPEDFFPTADVTREIKELCAGCPVRADCLADALNNKYQGWWGGTSDDERKRMKGRRVKSPKGLKPCGTWAAVMRHRRYSQPLCDPCRQAERDHYTEQAARRRQNRESA